jgi:tRNA threonylcarbamoyl adenosine modification protein YjeE
VGKEGLFLSLIGTLGAGKTAFVKGFAEGFGVEGDKVASPTFVIASEYETPVGPRLVHVDFYRVESGEALEDTGFLDMLGPGAVVAVEWADRFPEALPRDCLELRIEREAVAQGADGGQGAAESTPRSFCARATGEGAGRALARWRAGLPAVEGIEILEI